MTIATHRRTSQLVSVHVIGWKLQTPRGALEGKSFLLDLHAHINDVNSYT